MTIAPPVLDFTLNPGDVVKDVVRVTNNERSPFAIRPRLANFSAQPDDEISGAPEFHPADEVRTGYELAPWIRLSGEEQTVGPDEIVNFPITIAVPKDAQPGSHFGAVQILAGDPGTDLAGKNLGIERGVSVLIFIRVNGNAREELSVSRFGADRTFYSHLPAAFQVRLSNTGTTHLRPTGDIFVRNLFGHQVAALPVNPGPDFKAVLPDAARRFNTEWIRRKLPADTSEYRQQFINFAFGKYEATLVLNYGTNGRLVTATTTFWVVPWLALLAAVLAAALLTLVLILAIRGYNRLVIRRYEATKKLGRS